MQEAVIVSAVRTAIGSFNGSLRSFSAPELGAVAISAALQKVDLPPDSVEEVIMGNVLQAGLGQNPARQAAIKAGLPVEIPAYTVNKVCGSGLKAVTIAAQSILAGDADILIAGGMESMTNAPYVLNKARWGYRMGHQSVTDVLVNDGLWCAFNNYHMGITAENVAARYGITREQQDELALASQSKAHQAIEGGAFKQEIVPVVIKSKTGDSMFATDEFPKPETSLASLSRLKPAFAPNGTVTAGNASGINDGAAALLLMSRQKATALGLKPLARIVGYGAAGVDPAVMGLGPVQATRKALAKAGLALADIDLIEANEAFAAQFLAVGKELGLAPDKVNVNGGAIALGHPIGASGARILVTLLHALQSRGLKRGLATLCIGGGQGIAIIIEQV